MKYSEIEDCEQCPLLKESICPGGWSSGAGGTPIEPPCTSFDPDTDLDDWVNRYYKHLMKLDEQEEAKRKAEQQRQRERVERSLKRMHTKNLVYAETQEIKLLRKKIANAEAYIHFSTSLADALNFANEAARSKERVEFKQKSLLEEHIAQWQKRIAELELIKKQKIKEDKKKKT